jgi:phosphatidylglycerophosphate synthase
VTPNHITSLRLATGLAGAAAFAAGTPPWQGVGAGLFLLAMLLDRADGELARLSGRSSRWGHVYDLVADAACNALAFVGLGVGLARSEDAGWPIPLGIAAGLAVAAILWLVIRVEGFAGERAAELAGRAGFDPDDALLIVPLAVVLAGTAPLIVAAGFGAPAFALYMFWRFRRQLAPQRLR